MAWKSTGRPTVRRQRDKWVVRVDGIDTETGKRDHASLAPTRRSVPPARRWQLLERGDVESAVRANKGTVAEFIDAWAASKVDVSAKSRQQYEWAAGHIRKGLGGSRSTSSPARTSRAGSTAWPPAAYYARRSIQIFRMVLRAALDEAVDERPPASQPGGARRHAPPGRQARPGARGAGVDRGRRPHVPRRHQRPPLVRRRSASTSSTGCAAASCSA